MKQSVTFYQFCDAFSETYKNNFTYEGKKALFEYLEQYEEETGEEIELDPVSLCCEYTEYESLKEFQEAYDVDGGKTYETLDDIRDNTQIIEIEGTERFIVLDF